MNFFMYLRIEEEDLPIETILNCFEKTPSTLYRKGEKKNYRGNFVEYAKDCIQFEKEYSNKMLSENVIKNFITDITASPSVLKGLSLRHKISLYISLYPENEQVQVELSPTLVDFLSACGVHFSISVMMLKDFYGGKFR